MVYLWIMFAALSCLIYVAGGRLTYYGDVLGEKWNVERSFIGLILLSLITSLPELGTSLSSIIIVDSADLALGNILGSNLFNIFIIPIMALLFREAYLYRTDLDHSATGSLVLIIYAIVGMALSLRMFNWDIPTVLHMSPFSIAIFVVAAVGIYVIFASRKLPESDKSLEDVNLYPELSEQWASIVFILSAILVVGAGAGLAVVGKTLAVKTGLSETFFGTLFFAFVTSLPEVVVSWSALKQLDAVNLAMGNIMGSCLFNVGIIFIFDLASYPSPVFVVAGPSHLISVYAGITMIAITSYVIHIRKDNRARVFFSYEMVALSLIYLGAIYLLFITPA